MESREDFRGQWVVFVLPSLMKIDNKNYSTFYPHFLNYCNERLKDKTEGPTHFTYTGLDGGLGHLKIQTRLRDERFGSVMGECVI